jgi:23S rRNA U2552 (ribose-2'-O)-methylase RlmE/FtsJ
MASMNACILEHPEWDEYKKYTNPYEDIYNHSGYKPISHSYFKMIEIAHYHKILTYTTPIKTLHLANGHGFAEAIRKLRPTGSDVHVALTPYDPGWDFLHIETGADGAGNIMNPDNLGRLAQYGKMDVITGEGPCDPKGMMTQTLYALLLQKKTGSFVLKAHDLFQRSIVELLYLLCMCYRQVFIYKPMTSRVANSEKYIICKDFVYDSLSHMKEPFVELLSSLRQFDKFHLLSVDLPLLFVTRINEINAVLAQPQVDNIKTTVALIRTQNIPKIENMKQLHTKKCQEWCIKHD